MHSKRILIIGGGIAGLSAAHRVVERARQERIACSVRLLEAGPRPGGLIQSERRDGFLLEHGPDTLILRNGEVRSLCDRLGIGGELIAPEADGPELQILYRRRLHPLPPGFHLMVPTRVWPLLASPLFSWRGKLRMIAERWVPPLARPNGDQSLGEFVRRRFGQEALERVAEPILASLYLTDPEQLSLRRTLPQLLDQEQHHGSLTRGFRRAVNGDRTRVLQRGHSFEQGLQRLVDAIVDRLPPDCLQTGVRVDNIGRTAGDDGWTVRTDHAEMQADAVVLACPAPAAATIVGAVSADLQAAFADLAYASCTIVYIAYPRRAFAQSPRGHGFFVPRGEASPVLACGFVNNKFANRAPGDLVLLRAYVADAAGRADAADTTDIELRRLLSIRAEPVFRHVYPLGAAMPQLRVGDLNRVRRMQNALEGLPGLYVAGSAMGTVGISECVRAGELAAEQCLQVVGASGASAAEENSVEALPLAD